MKEASGNPEFILGNAVAAGPEESGNSNPHKEVRVSGDNISLYVEFRSPKCKVGEVGNPEEAGDRENMGAIGTEGFEFSAGDIVWVKTKTKLWWPGKIRNPSDVSKHRVKTEPEGCLLVSYMANGHVSWYHPSQLKPFYENFVHMSRQNKSRGFVAAVERAMDEFGICVQSRLTSLFSLQAQGQASSTSVRSNKASTVGAYGDISATLLDSRNLVSHLKNLASAISKPRVLEPAILRGYISAFYCSLRHLDLSTNLLGPMANAEVAASGLGVDLSVKSKNLLVNKIESDKGVPDICKSEVVVEEPKRESKSHKKKRADNSIVRDGGGSKVEGLDGPITQDEGSGSGSTEKGSDLRPRKKSKYLSYPYINLEGKGSTVQVDNEAVGSGPVAKPSSMFQQKWSKIFSKISVEEFSSISSNEFLLGLRIAASGCLYPIESEKLEMVEGFFYRFRRSSFHSDRSIDEMYNNSMVVKEKQNERAGEAEEARKNENSGKKNSESPPTATDEIGRKEKSEENNPESPLTANVENGEKKEKPGEKNSASPPTATEENGGNSEVRKPPYILPEEVNIGIATPLDLPTKDSSNFPDLNAGGNSAVRSDFSGTSVLPVLVGFTEGDRAKKKRKRMKDLVEPGKAVESPGAIPNLNGTQMSANSSGKDPQGPSVFPDEIDLKKRRRQARGTPIILTFSEGNPMPPKEVLEAEFSKFGTLQNIVAPVVEDPNVARVIFERKSAANKAHRSLEKGNLFGGALLKFELQISVPSKALQNLTMKTASFSNGVSTNLCPKPPGPAARTVEPPVPTLTPVLTPAAPLDHIKQNLEMMTLMLKQSGDDLSPETKAKLELEIKGLLSKVSTRVCSPSS
ncbi:serine/threonine-protein kinase ATM [Punica granatum]|uniref:Serine/threonine-protein kinase ATM n=1 Tax=Punica granatum TaxID=22663 RepID=A0A218VY25_PUNGR|nr:serine/threonine-protein kinase ATM [Punica granatum]XP_031406000.1 serine/threonine-protein kinase ATM [Punica granatum]OWM65444.1 hypothetical protein CDL15_Pgr009034 [Punica granatum]